MKYYSAIKKSETIEFVKKKKMDKLGKYNINSISRRKKSMS